MEIGVGIENIHPNYQKQRESIIKEFAAAETRPLVDLRRITTFLQDEGFTSDEIKPVIFIHSEDDIEKLKQYSPQVAEGINASSGYYDADLDLVMVRSDFLGEENEFSAEYQAKLLALKATIVHELIHATSNTRHYEPSSANRPEITQVGFANNLHGTNPTGLFLEEGFAEYMASEYVRKNITDRVKSEVTGSSDYWEGGKIPIPTDFMALNKEGKVVMPATAYAGFAVSLLCKHDNELLSDLKAARRDNSLFPSLSNILEGIMPGLPQKIKETPYTTAAFASLAKEITSATQPLSKAA